MKKMSLQWRLTCIITIYIAVICGCLTMLVYKNGVYYIDSLKETVDARGDENADDTDEIYISIPEDNWDAFANDFSVQVYNNKADYRKNSLIISAVLALCTEQNCWSSIWASIWPILYVGIFSSGVAYTLQIVAIKGSNPAVVSLLLSLESVFAVLSGALILHERLSARELMGCGLIFVAVILTQLPQRREKTAPLAAGEGGKQNE